MGHKKKLNFNLKEASEKRLLRLNELEELRNGEEMGVGVSLPLFRYGFPVVGLVPFMREHGLSESFNLPDFQMEEGDSCRVSLVESVNLLSYVVPVYKVRVRYGGRNLPVQGFGAHPLKNRVSLSKKGKVTNGDHLPSSFLEGDITDSGLPKKGSSCADADFSEMDISEISRCAVGAGSVGTEDTRNIGGPEDVATADLYSAPTRLALVRSGYGGSGSRDLKCVPMTSFSLLQLTPERVSPTPTLPNTPIPAFSPQIGLRMTLDRNSDRSQFLSIMPSSPRLRCS